MDEDIEIEFTPEKDDEEPILEGLWVPYSNEEALRWECLLQAISVSSGKDILPLARDIFIFITKGKTGPVGVVKDSA
jgi:hypothetical protein